MHHATLLLEIFYNFKFATPTASLTSLALRLVPERGRPMEQLSCAISVLVAPLFNCTLTIRIRAMQQVGYCLRAAYLLLAGVQKDRLSHSSASS